MIYGKLEKIKLIEKMERSLADVIDAVEPSSVNQVSIDIEITVYYSAGGVSYNKNLY